MKKTIIDFNKNVTLLDGSTSEQHLGQIVANAINSAKEGDALKLRSWAFDLYGKKTLELDSSDLEVFKAVIQKSEYLTVISKGEALQIIADSK